MAYLSVTGAWSRWKPSNAASPERATYGKLAAALDREPPHPSLYSRNSRRRAMPDLQKPSYAHAHGRRVFALMPLAPRACPRISRNYVPCWRTRMPHTKQTSSAPPSPHARPHVPTLHDAWPASQGGSRGRSRTVRGPPTLAVRLHVVHRRRQ
jgi:hypothetical protein